MAGINFFYVKNALEIYYLVPLHGQKKERNLMKRITVLSILLSICLLSMDLYAQDKDKILQVKDMHKDLDYYLENLTEVHPNPFVVLSEKEFKFKIDSLKQIINKPLSKKEFYLHISSMNKYTDLHSRVAGSKKMLQQQNKSYKFPSFFIEQNQIAFYDNTNGKQYIKSINGIDIETIKEFFFSRRNLLEVSNEYNARDIISYWINEHFTDTVLNISTKNNEGIQTVFTYNPVEPTKKSKNNKENGKGIRVWNLETDTVQRIAVFELNTFMPKKFRQQLGFIGMIDKVFDTLKQREIKRLYIDVTCNGGGLVAFEEYLLNYLITDTNRKVSWDLVIKQSKQRREQRGNVFSVEDGDFHQQRQYLNVRNMKNKFRGEIYVIQSRKSFSAASTLAAHLQRYAKAKIIGEECQIKAVYTDPIMITLPESKFQFPCASGFIRNVGTQKEKGVIPDIYFNIENVYAPISIEQAEQMRKSAENK